MPELRGARHPGCRMVRAMLHLAPYHAGASSPRPPRSRRDRGGRGEGSRSGGERRGRARRAVPRTRSSWTCAAVCGTSFAQLLRQDEPGPTVSPRDAFLWSLTFPGVGHAKAGRGADGIARGTLFVLTFGLALVVVLSGVSSPPVFAVVALLLVSAITIYLGSAAEAYRIADGGCAVRVRAGAPVGDRRTDHGLGVPARDVRGHGEQPLTRPGTARIPGSDGTRRRVDRDRGASRGRDGGPRGLRVVPAVGRGSNRGDPPTRRRRPCDRGGVRGRGPGARQGDVHADVPLRARGYRAFVGDQGGSGGDPRHPRRVPPERGLRLPRRK